VIAGFQPSLAFPDQFISCLYAYFTACASGETLYQTPSIGYSRFSLSGDVSVYMQLLDTIHAEGLPTQWTGRWMIEMGQTSIGVSALVGKCPLPHTPSKRRGRKLSRVVSLQDLRMHTDRDIRHRLNLDEPATSRVESKMTKRAHSIYCPGR
jgi:hypothetical protein